MARKKQGPKIGSVVRAGNGRLVATYSKSDLYKLVALAARKTKPHAPETLSVREFDRALGSIGYPDAPSGRAIYGRLKRPWPEIVALALRDMTANRADDAVSRKKEGHWMTERHLFYALKTLARFKDVTTFTPMSYDAARDEYLRSPERQRDAEMHEQHLPTSSQILRIAAKLAGDDPLWEKALRYAGLTVETPSQQTGMPVAEAIYLYIRVTGLLPTRREIRRLGKEWKIAIAFERGRLWQDSLDECRQLREERGETMPTESGGHGRHPALVKPDTLAAPARRTKAGRWQDEELVIERLTIYVLDCRAQSIRPRQKHYKEWSKGRDDFPAASTICRKDRGFTDWIAIVEERLLQAKKAA
jgi:hypothetical protein